jgi:Flp pilus assembly pilin Flp
VGYARRKRKRSRRRKDVKKLAEFIRDESGAELAEYAVGTAILVAIAIVVYQILGSAVNVKMNRVANEIQK